jgi:hypothetical protein
MSKRLEELLMKQDRLLTERAQGYGNADNSYVASLLFPQVNVDEEFVRVPEYGKEHLRIYKTERALHAGSNNAEPEGIKDQGFVLEEHDLQFAIDYREARTARKRFDLEAQKARQIQDAFALKNEYLCASLAQNPAVYSANNKIALSGTDKWTNAASKPIDQLLEGRSGVRQACGRYPNTLVLGSRAYESLHTNKQIQDRLLYRSAGVLSVDILRELTGVQRIGIAQSVWHDEASNQFVDVWQDVAIMAYVPVADSTQTSEYTSAFGYRFVYTGFPSYDKYQKEGGKVNYVRGTTIQKTALLNADLGFLITSIV